LTRYRFTKLEYIVNIFAIVILSGLVNELASQLYSCNIQEYQS
jgi:hypothetical protein